MSQYLMVILFLLTPIEITATHDTDLDQLRKEVMQIEADTRAWRQRKSGGGL